MNLLYSDETKDRLRQWRDADPSLYRVTEKELQAIASNPHTHGMVGSPYVPRLVSYGVNGRDDEYVITWEVRGDSAIIGTVASMAEMRQRARLHGLSR